MFNFCKHRAMGSTAPRREVKLDLLLNELKLLSMKIFTKVLFALPLTALASALIAAPSQAAGLTYAQRVEAIQFGTYRRDDGTYRRNTDNALLSYDKNATRVQGGQIRFNPESRDFLSLGLGGKAIFSFGTDFTQEVRIWETTWGSHNNQSAHDERVKIFVGNTASFDATDWVALGDVWNIRDQADRKVDGVQRRINDGRTYRYVKVVDISPSNTRSLDGFDVNAIAVRAVPEPTTMSGLAIAAGGVFAMRRRRKAQQAAQES